MINVAENVEKRKPLYTVGRQTGTSPVENILKMELPHDTVIPLLRLYLDKSKNTDLKEYMGGEGGGEIGGSGVQFPSTPVKHLVDLRSKANSQRYSSIYEDRRPKIEGIERSDGKKSA